MHQDKASYLCKREENSQKTTCTVHNMHILICINLLSCALDKFWYCRLSPNHKVLHYGDIEEFSQGQISHDSLQEKGE